MKRKFYYDKFLTDADEIYEKIVSSSKDANSTIDKKMEKKFPELTLSELKYVRDYIVKYITNHIESGNLKRLIIDGFGSFRLRKKFKNVSKETIKTLMSEKDGKRKEKNWSRKRTDGDSI
jgi:nucleoid DNA-binding protein